MYTFLITLIVILSILLTLVVLVQNSKGGGLSSEFASSNQVFGAKKTTDIIEKITWGLVGSIVVFCIIATAFIDPVKQDVSKAPSISTEAVATPNVGFDITDENQN